MYEYACIKVKKLQIEANQDPQSSPPPCHTGCGHIN